MTEINQKKLKVSKNSKSSLNELELYVEAPLEFSEKAYGLALRDITNNIDIPGFRKGKAPREIVEQKATKGYISQKAFEAVFYDLLADVAIQEKLDIVDVIEISSFELLPEKPLTFKVLVELKPEIKLGKYKNLEVKARKIVYDKEIFIQKTLEKIANKLVTFNKITDRSVKEGDQITVDFEGKFDDGTEVPGGKAEGFVATLDKEKFLPEFVDKLKGTKIGETREVIITFPENYAQGFSGKKAKFKLNVLNIEEKVIPEINDDLAKKVGLENLKSLKDKIVEQMMEIQNLNSQTDFENKIVDHVIQNSKIEISPRMINKEVDYLLNDVRMQCEKNQIGWDTFRADEKNKELFEKANEAAIKRISIDLALSAIIKNEKLFVSTDEVDNEVRNRIVQLGDKYKNLENDKRFRNSVEMVILRNKAVDFLVKNNKVAWDEEVTKIIPD